MLQGITTDFVISPTSKTIQRCWRIDNSDINYMILNLGLVLTAVFFLSSFFGFLVCFDKKRIATILGMWYGVILHFFIVSLKMGRHRFLLLVPTFMQDSEN